MAYSLICWLSFTGCIRETGPRFEGELGGVNRREAEELLAGRKGEDGVVGEVGVEGDTTVELRRRRYFRS